MDQFLIFDDETSARKRNREMMGGKRKPDNTDGDGKPYVTTERCSLRVADDGQVALKVSEDQERRLSDSERRALLAERPAKFEKEEDSGVI